MKIEVDEREFDDLQKCVVAEIVASVHRGVTELELTPEQREDVVRTIALDVGCAIDASTVMEHEGKAVLPVLTFAKSSTLDHVVSRGGSAFMHEYVHDATEELLAGEDRPLGHAKRPCDATSPRVPMSGEGGRASQRVSGSGRTRPCGRPRTP